MNPNNIRDSAKWLFRLTLIAAMVLCLAFTAQYSLSFLATTPALDARARTRFMFVGLPAIPPKAKSELRLDDLVVDGRRLRFGSTELSSHWTATDERGRLLYNGGPEPGSVSFAGEGFLLVAKARAWSGIVEVQRENGERGSSRSRLRGRGQQT